MSQTPPSGTILVVDDTPENLRLLVGFLKHQGYQVRPAPSGALALRAIEVEQPDLILLDINMPDMNGFEVGRRLKAQEATRDIPIIFISAMADTLDKVTAFSSGGVDYITKPFQLEEVQARVETHLRLRRLQRELGESYHQLQRLEDLRDNLVHMLVHDMKSPLATLGITLDLLKQDLGQRDILAQSLEDIQTAGACCARLLGMANELLEVSRLEAGELPINRQECDLGELARSVVASLQVGMPDRQAMVEAPAVVRCSCDVSLIRRVIENLVSNGLRHTSAGQVVHVEVSTTDHATRVMVHHEGPGIPVELQRRLFDKFGALEARRAQAYHSTGLGLAFSRLAVEAHGGQIGLESEPGKGNTFWFTLPPGPRPPGT
jgi:two-component system, sensor histidine kinase and response regulator